MATSKPNKIDKMLEMAQEMIDLGISTEGFAKAFMDEMRNQVKKSAIGPSWTVGEAYSVLSEAKQVDEKKRKELLTLYEDAELIMKKLDKKILDLLEQYVGNVKEKMENQKERLKCKEYFLLVAGETSSGKSSLINLIMGEELLPYSVLSTTSTICELKFGKERKIVAHFKDKDPDTGLPTKVIRLKENPNTTSEKQSYLQQISCFVHVKNDRDKGSIYKKIELFWPHGLLQSGIVIVDSPGVGESNIMDKIVTEYLPKAFAFIYTINSSNAGGIQKDRLERLLEEVRKLSLERGEGQLPSKCAIFVCNKWDQVPEEEHNEVKSHVVQKLQRCWPGLDPETQIIYMSTKNATKAQKMGIITNEFSSFMETVQMMVLRSIQCQLEIHWRWVKYVLSRITVQLKAFVSNACRNREEVNEKLDRIRQRLSKIESEQKEMMRKLEQYSQRRTDEAIQELYKYLSTEEVKTRFTSWTLDEVPEVHGSWEVTEFQIMKVISGRLQAIIGQWEEDYQVFADARKSVLKHFQQRYNFVESQLQNLQSAITVDNNGVQRTPPPQANLTTGDKVTIGVLSPIWIPLGLIAAVIGSPVVAIKAIKENITERKKIKKYEADKCGFMVNLSEKYLEEAKCQPALEEFVKKQLQEVKISLQQIQVRIPQLIKADQMLCEQLKDEKLKMAGDCYLYTPNLEEFSKLQGDLAVFGFKEVLDHISSNELEWKKDRSHHLGEGSFACVYKGMMNKGGSSQPVALKVSHQELYNHNASEVIAEVELLRKLEHPHVVKFYGTSLLDDDGSTRVVLVMEKCKGSLKRHIFSQPECIPGKTGQKAERIASLWVKQITDALDYIHRDGILHRDLKLKNILLSEDDKAKLTDVGTSKAEADIRGTLAETPLYMAPEVTRFDIYEFSADIYSLGIMLWEMWYGQQVFSSVPVLSIQDLFAKVQDGLRPEHVPSYFPPSPAWKGLMEWCWSQDPKERPNAQQCNEAITRMIIPLPS
ncbi:dual serine/threonine and tyrosine protein kinase-like [Acropora muricata]|uniref:dual serine/threonine and tyrosine protein kinase-like n=1 Tax=Acropora muricata TaxID=159855 RepID=UPI0034E46D27